MACGKRKGVSGARTCRTWTLPSSKFGDPWLVKCQDSNEGQANWCRKTLAVEKGSRRMLNKTLLI